jgi:hypothetical protein
VNVVCSKSTNTCAAYNTYNNGLARCQECTDNANSPLLFELGSSQSGRVIILSRKQAEFDKLLRSSLQLPMDQSTVGPDIIHFMEQEIDRNPDLQPLKTQIREKAMKDCQGMFLWAKLLMDSLRKEPTIRLQREVLQTFPPGLFEVYHRELKAKIATVSAGSLKICRQIFLLVLNAMEPLTVEEISTALALDCVSNDINDEDRLHDPANAVLRLCGPLITVVNERAQMIRTSVKDFLQRLNKSNDPALRIDLDISADDSNTFLALKSLTKLSQAEYRLWEFPATLLRKHLLEGHIFAKPTLDSYEGSVFYNYACLHWHEHVTALKRPPEALLTKLSQFLTGNEFVTWSEVLFDLKNQSGLDP